MICSLGSRLPWLALLTIFVYVEAAATTSPRVVPMRFEKASNSRYTHHKRDTVTLPLGNRLDTQAYLVNATIGTPGQEIQFGIDTGSSDIWMFAKGVCTAGASTYDHACVGGDFDSSESSTFRMVGRNAFSIEYVDGSEVDGDYFDDNIEVGGALVRGQRLAQATTSEAGNYLGIMGIGFSSDVAAYQTYPTLLDNMVKQGLVASHTYSLWLDNLGSDSGTILIGGYDKAKYVGDLVALPVQLDGQTGTLSHLAVTWSSLGVTDESGSISLPADQFPISAVLDTGTSLTYIPPSIYEQLSQYFGVDPGYSYSDAAFVSCNNVQNKKGSLDFGFGGTNGPVIRVPFSELAVPVYGPNNEPQKFADGSKACLLGIAPATDGYYLLGDTFLRSVYLVYDLENKEISIAQTDFEATTSDIVEIPARQQNLPDVTSTATATAQVTGYGGYGDYGGYGSYASYDPFDIGYSSSSYSFSIIDIGPSIIPESFSFSISALPSISGSPTRSESTTARLTGVTTSYTQAVDVSPARTGDSAPSRQTEGAASLGVGGRSTATMAVMVTLITALALSGSASFFSTIL